MTLCTDRSVAIGFDDMQVLADTSDRVLAIKVFRRQWRLVQTTWPARRTPDYTGIVRTISV